MGQHSSKRKYLAASLVLVAGAIILVTVFIRVNNPCLNFPFGQTYLQTSPKTFFVIQGGVLCAEDDRSIKVYITNTGYCDNLALDKAPDGDFMIAKIDNISVPSLAEGRGNGFQGGVINPGEAGLVIDYDCGTNGCTQGSHLVDLGTPSGVLHLNIFCP